MPHHNQSTKTPLPSGDPAAGSHLRERGELTRVGNARLDDSLAAFVRWLDRYGETSWDFQTFYAGRLGKRAKALYYRNRRLGTIAVAPIVFCEAFLPTGRRFFFVRQRFPIADAHYAMGFAFLAQRNPGDSHYRRAVHFLEALLASAIDGYSGQAWGYPFDWETINGRIKKGTPLITTLPYVYEAFSQVYGLDRLDQWRSVMQSIAEHALLDFKDHPTSSTAATTSYTPEPTDRGQVVNASAYRAFLLTQAAADFHDERCQRAANRNLQFVLDCQNADGSWYYAADGRREFIDHFHTCFVLKSLAKIARLTGDEACLASIDRGIRYYVANLFDDAGLPRPFAKAPRLVVYKRELYDYAECLNLATLLGDRYADLTDRAINAIDDVITRWQKPDGSFRSRQLLLGWDNVPMHRWAQAQLFRSLCAVQAQEREKL